MTKPRKLAFLHLLLLAFAVVSARTVLAAGSVTTYSAGDIFLGFRQAGVADTLAVDLGSFTQFLPFTYAGGTWDGNPFQVQFGIVPAGNAGAGTPVFSLAADLEAVFGSAWADNDQENSQNDVSWAVAGQTSNTANGSPVAGLNRRSAFQTVARTDPGTIASAPLNFSNSSFATEFNSFAQGTAGGNAYKGRISTSNSTAAYIGAASDSNNWGSRIGGQLSGSTFNSGTLGEQPFSGPGSGPSNSILDLYLFPSDGSTLITQPTYLGSFSLSEEGILTYQAVPEPTGAALLAAGALFLGGVRIRKAGANSKALLERTIGQSARSMI